MRGSSPAVRSILWLGAGCALLAATMIAALMFGAFTISVGEIGRWITGSGASTPDAVAERVLTSIRLPRVLAAAAVGGGLGSIGAVLQGTYRTPLVDGHLLGYSSAAGVGAALGFALTPIGAWPLLPVAFAAVAGGLFGLVTAALRSRTGSDRFVLAGVALGLAMLAWTGLFVLVADSPRVPTLMFFIFGSLSGTTWRVLLTASIVLLPAVLVTWRLAPGLDLLSLGHREARTLGFDTGRLVPTVVAAAGIAVGATVVLGGVVGFIGLVIPFLLRPHVGSSHRVLIPASAIGGAAAVVVVDTMARTLVAPSEIPLGLITAAIGGPFLGWLLLRRHAQ